MKDFDITYKSPDGREITVNTYHIDEDVLRIRMGLEPHKQNEEREKENV